MRRTLTICRSGIAVTAAVVLLSACGGSDSKNNASSSSAAVTSASKTSGATSEFCSSAATIQGEIVAALASPGAGSGAPAALQSILTQVREVQPPSAIASDWAAISAGLEQFAASQAPVDPADPSSAAAFQEKVVALETELGPSLTNVLAYLGSECGIPTPNSSTAPTS